MKLKLDLDLDTICGISIVNLNVFIRIQSHKQDVEGYKNAIKEYHDARGIYDYIRRPNIFKHLHKVNVWQSKLEKGFK